MPLIYFTRFVKVYDQTSLACIYNLIRFLERNANGFKRALGNSGYE